MNPLDYVLQRMQEIKPRYDELAEKDKLEGEERSEYDRMKTEWDDLDERRVDLEDRARRAAAAGTINFNLNRNPDPYKVDLRSLESEQVLGFGKAAIDASRNRFTKTEHGDAAVRLIERGGRIGELVARLAITTTSRDYADAWIAAMTGRYVDPILDRATAEYRAWTSSGTTTGGYMTPLYMDPTIIVTGAGSFNPIRQVANVKQITTLTYNGASAAQVTAGVLGQNVAFSDNAPAVAQIQIPTFKYGAYLPASFEAFEDIDNLAADCQMLFADARDNLEASLFATGGGSTTVMGVVTAVTAVTASRVSPTTGGTYGVPDIYKMHQALPARFRYRDPGSRAWMMNVALIDATRQFATANNYHAFLTDLTGGQPPRLLGDQLLEASTMSGTVTTGQNVQLYGDFSRYYIIDRIGMTTEFIPNVVDSSGLPTGTRAWLMHWRVGGDVADANAFRILLL